MRQGFVLFSRILFVFVFVFSLVPLQSASADANLTITPITWNVVGLDSNNVNVGPNTFPIGARVCNTGDATATNVSSEFHWETVDPTPLKNYIDNRGGSATSYSGYELAPTECVDFYYEIEVTRNSNAYNDTRRYYITATADTLGTVETPRPREIFVEYLVSQNRNSTLDVQLDGASIAPGGTMSLVVGQTYTITLIAKTATQGYEQIESFINFPNTIFQVLNVNTTYSAESSGSMTPPYDTLYGDACIWQNDPNSPQYRDCLSVGKAGGNITVEYEVTIIGGAGTDGILNTLIYDFSGSSYHYNSDYSVGGRLFTVLNPATVDISKSFAPAQTTEGGVSVLTLTLTNPNAAPISGVSFTDPLPSSPAQMTVASTPNASTAGCGAPTFAPTAGATSLSFTNGTIAANGTCTINVNVTAPIDGTYTNTTDSLFVGATNTGKTAIDDLIVNDQPPAPACIDSTIAEWTFPAGFSTTSPLPSTGTGSASPGLGLTSTSFTEGTNSWGSNGNITTGATLVTSNDEYLEFSINTTGYSTVSLAFDAARKNTPNSPRGIAVYYSTASGNDPSEPNAALFSNATALPLSTTAFSSFGSGGTISFPGNTGTTYVRIYLFNSGNDNSGSDAYVDNVTFTGCGVPQYPTLTKTFSPDPVAVNGTSTLTFAVNNPNTSLAFSGINFTDSLPSGVTVATSGPTAVCGGTLTTTSPSTISFTGGTLAANTSCNIPVSVTVTSAGPHTNVSGFISATYLDGGGNPNTFTNNTPTGFATDTITAILPPTISKLFAPNPILAGGVSTLTFVIENPNNDQPLSGVAFTDTFPVSPAAMTVASPTGVSTSGCGAPTFSPSAGAGSISFSGGSIIAGGTCIVTVNVTAPTNGNYVNTSGAVTAIINGSPVGTDTATDDMDVNAPNPGIAILKQVGLTDDPDGTWYNFLPVAEGVDVYYKITIENTGDVPLSPVSVNDPDVSTAGCTWTNPLPVADANDDDHIDFCVIGPVEAEAGSYDNTATATGTYGGSPYTDISTATYATPELTLTKSATQSYFVAEGDTINYSYLVENTGAVPLLGPVTVTDDKATVSCPAVSTAVQTSPAGPGDGDNYLDPGESITCTAEYDIVAGDVTAGFVTNTAEASVGGVDSNEDEHTVPRQLPDLTITKTNNTGDAGTVGVEFNWILTVSNAGLLGATFTDGQTLLSDPLPAGATYGTPTAGDFTGITNSANISCSIVLNNLTCTASGDDVTMGAATGSFTVTIPVTPTTGGNLENTATVDPGPAGGNITESIEGNNTGTNIVTVADMVNISLGKQVNDATPNVGDVVTFTLVVANGGPNTATNIDVTDVLPSGYTYVPASITGGDASDDSSPAGSGLTWTINSLASSGSVNLTYQATVLASGDYDNYAQIMDHDQPDSNSTPGNGQQTPDEDDDDTVNVTPNAVVNVSLDKQVNDATPNVGDVVTFTLVVANGGPSTATNIDVTDVLPSGYTYVPASITGGDASDDSSPAGTGLTWTINSLASSGSVNLTYQATVLASGDYDNYAQIMDHDQPDSNSTPGNGQQTPDEDDDDTVNVTPNAVVNVSLDKQVNDATPNVGDVVTFTLVVANGGLSTATNIDVTDVLPSGYTYVPASITGGDASDDSSPAGTGLTWTINSLASSGSVNLTYQATVLASGDYDNYAQIMDHDQPDSNSTPGNGQQTPDEDDDDTVNVTPNAVVNISLDKQVNDATPNVGDVVTFTLVVANGGPSTATNIDVTDVLPSGYTYVPASITGGDASDDSSPAGTGLTWTINSLTSSGSVNLTYQATVLASGDYDNYAQIMDHDQPDSNSTPGNGQQTPDEDDDDTVTVTPNPVADLSLTKSVNNSSPVIGNNVTFTLTLTNDGPSDATGVTVLDLLPAGLSYVSDNSASTATTYNSATGVWTVGSLSSGDSISLQITVQVTQGGAITNTAEVQTSDQFDPNSTPNNNTPSENDQDSAIVGGIFDPPSALKTFNDAGLPELEFRMVWINSSNIAAIDVQVTDTIPVGTTYVPGSIDCDPQGSSSTVNAGVFTTPVSPLGAAVPTWSCGFDAATNRVQWQGTIGPDDGNLTEAAANNEVIITFRVTVDNAVNQVQNTGSSRTDINENGNFDEETVLNTSVINSNVVIWNRAQDPDPETPPSSPDLPFLLPVTGFAPNIVSALPEQPASKAYSATGVWLEIPSLNVQMPIVGVPLVDEDWDVSWLGNQAGWLEGTAFPSWKGNSAVTGHVTLADGTTGPFAKLGNLKWGDTVVVHAYGYVYTYQVRENKVIAPSNTSVLKHEADSWLTLITCKNYNEATDTYANRVSVRAVLISVQKEPAKLIPLGVR